MSGTAWIAGLCVAQAVAMAVCFSFAGATSARGLDSTGDVARVVAQQTRLPSLILWLLIALSLLSALYTAAISLTTYAVLDLDNPRLGLIRLDAAEQVLQHLHDGIR